MLARREKCDVNDREGRGLESDNHGLHDRIAVAMASRRKGRAARCRERVDERARGVARLGTCCTMNRAEGVAAWNQHDQQSDRASLSMEMWMEILESHQDIRGRPSRAA